MNAVELPAILQNVVTTNLNICRSLLINNAYSLNIQQKNFFVSRGPLWIKVAFDFIIHVQSQETGKKHHCTPDTTCYNFTPLGGTTEYIISAFFTHCTIAFLPDI